MGGDTIPQLNSNGAITDELNLQNLPYGNYLVRSTYNENTHYKTSTNSFTIHNMRTEDQNKSLFRQNHFCVYDPNTEIKGEVGENITSINNDTAIRANNQFIIGTETNSTSMEVVIGVNDSEGILNSTIHLLYSSAFGISLSCKDDDNNLMHIYYTHPTNDSYINVDIPTQVDMTQAELFHMIIDDNGRITIRVTDHDATTLNYTYAMPQNYVLDNEQLAETVTGIQTTGVIEDFEGIEYVFTYTPHKQINCQDNQYWRGKYWEVKEDSATARTTTIGFDAYNYVTANYTRGYEYYSHCSIPLERAMRIEVELTKRKSVSMYSYGLLEIFPSSNKKFVVFTNGSVATLEERHPTIEQNSTITKFNNTLHATYIITQDGYIHYSDDAGNEIVSENPFSQEELQVMRFGWKVWNTTDAVSITSMKIYEDYSEGV